MAIENDDLLIIGRGSNHYKYKFEDFKEAVGGGGFSGSILQFDVYVTSDNGGAPGTLTASGGDGLGPSGDLSATYQWYNDETGTNEIVGATGTTLNITDPGLHS